MTILTTLETIDTDITGLDENEARRKAAVNLAELFEQYHDHAFRCTTVKMTLGKYDPERLRAIARGWNKNLVDVLFKVLKDIWPDLNDPEKPDDEKFDTLKTYELKKTAQGLDNEYTPFGAFAVIYPGEFSFSPIDVRTVVTEDLLADIERHPENYAVFTSDVHEAKAQHITPAYDWYDD